MRDEGIRTGNHVHLPVLGQHRAASGQFSARYAAPYAVEKVTNSDSGITAIDDPTRRIVRI